MNLEDFNYSLPKNLIAQKLIYPRDHSRLMVLERKNKKIGHHYFFEIGRFLKEGDVLVLNRSKVFPARLHGRKTSGGRVEIILLRPEKKEFSQPLRENLWRVIGRPRLKVGQRLIFSSKLEAEIIKDLKPEKLIKFSQKGENLEKLIYQLGKTPTPPYIQPKIQDSVLRKQYQTVYAEEIGSAAAPTAGFHFTKKLIQKLKNQGVRFEKITLHIGRATFEPIKGEKIPDAIPEEFAVIEKKTSQRLNQAKKEGRRIIAVGTTVVRTLEGFAKNGWLTAGKKFVDLFIYPGYQFKFIDGLITNFHLPRSTNLILVATFAGKNFLLKAYQEAVRKKYRFYTFGDAMFIF
ncbi:MAG: tRNA preQ1(34) S-adenosylmethionine ribosyltransferase-isomerase QueA [Patescibacteria group bacterium]|nr:tRNA preQ1(34) S-adenosylmethionine ribosyltransferase-isomerase QueA [Patescibacteria group bacterium]